MISQLRGHLLEKRPPLLVLDVAGVGYELQAPLSVFYDLPELGVESTFFTHCITREEMSQLFGFITRMERDVFRALLKVTGVGPKAALALLSGISAPDLVHCVHQGDTQMLSRVPGIGRKTAERIVLDLQDRLSTLVNMNLSPGASAAMEHSVSTASCPDPVQEAITALVSLGFKPLDAKQKVDAVYAQGLSVEALIRRALKEIVA